MSEAVCPACFRHCRVREGETGFCLARGNKGGEIVCMNYGKVISVLEYMRMSLSEMLTADQDDE